MLYGASISLGMLITSVWSSLYFPKDKLIIRIYVLFYLMTKVL